jgi:DNA-binding MarR family transcriptional regulator
MEYTWIMTDDEDHIALFARIVRTELMAWHAVDSATTAEAGISLAMLTALRNASLSGGKTRIQDVAKGMGVTVGAASKVVDRLEKAGLARRVPNPADGRSSLVLVTPTGKARALQGSTVMAGVLSNMMDDLSADDVSHLHAALSRLKTPAPQRL